MSDFERKAAVSHGMTARNLYQNDEEFRRATDERLEAIRTFISDLSGIVHEFNLEWWLDPETKQPVKRNVGETLMLIVSELGEAMEAHRRQARDSHLPHRPGLEVELADALIRLVDCCAGYRLDLAGAVCEKLRYNLLRSDHNLEERAKPGGKKV
jgi:NTP pyrophosphatase (non-canonical NTP hydrolase)